MNIPPFYTVTSEMIQLIVGIESLLKFFSTIEIPYVIQDKIQRVSFLKSSLYSARIEGNSLTLKDFTENSDKLQQKEIENILNAIHFIGRKMPRKTKMSKKMLLQLHRIVTKDVEVSSGHFRQEMSAIFNQAGVAIYVPPSPQKIIPLLDELINYIEGDTEKLPYICAFISHLVFEKIHPFVDGNGRVGRLLISAILKTKNKTSRLFVPYEKYLDNHKDEYYYHLSRGMTHTNDYLIFMLTAFLEETRDLEKEIKQKLADKESLFLPPRQEEIYRIIRDHDVVSFDFIRRRFLKVPPRTLRYEVKKLVDSELVVKIGKTKGSYYKSK